MNKCAMQSLSASSIHERASPTVAIFRTPLFNSSETFVSAHACTLARYRPLFVGLENKGNVPEEIRGAICLPASWSEGIKARMGGWAAMAVRLRREGVQLVHAHFATDGLRALPLARALGVPLITTLHGFDVSRSRARMLASGRLSWTQFALFERRLMARGSLFLAVSEALRVCAVARGYPAERTRTHYLGVDLARFTRATEPEPGLVLHVGRLVEKKGTAVLIEAIAALPEARLVVIGDGPLRASLERQAAALGDRVRFLGTQSPADVAASMRRAWVLAAPSVTAHDGDAEGLPTVVVEAAAASLPAVGTVHAGIPEAIRQGESGFLVAERDARALSAALSDLLASPQLRARMGAAARTLAEERFDAARQGSRLETIYDEVRGQTLSCRMM